MITDKSLSEPPRQRILKTLLVNLIQRKLVVTIRSAFASLNYVINLFVNLLILSSNLVCRMAFSHQNQNYRTVSLLPICSEIFERIIYNTMFTYFMGNNLISENQSGVTPCDSCVNQLLAINHEIFSYFDAKLQWYSLTFHKLSIKCGTRELFIN